MTKNAKMERTKWRNDRTFSRIDLDRSHWLLSHWLLLDEKEMGLRSASVGGMHLGFSGIAGYSFSINRKY